MPAPNSWTLYDFETQLEAASKDVVNYFLNLSGLDATVYTPADGEIQSVPRIKLEVSVSSAIPQWGAQGQGHNPKQVPVARFFEIRASIVDTKPSTEIGPLRGLVRWALSAGAKGFNTINLPYLQVLELYDVTGLQNIENDDKEQQNADVSFGGQFAVRNDAWPSTP